MPVKNKKAKGSRNELRSKKLLELWGYKVCKSGGSLGEFDLIGVNLYNVILVQSKTNHRPDNKELFEILDFDAPPDATKHVHIWVDRQKDPIILDKPYIRRILDGKPLETDIVRRGNDIRLWFKNARKAKTGNKQRTAKKRPRRTSIATDASNKRRGGASKVSRKCKASSIS